MKMIEHPLQPILSTLPTLPGCYVYKDYDGKVLYVGKAKNLRKRVTSYFANYKKLTARLQLLIDNATDIEIHTVNTEIEALLLEASLIKKYLPKYNVLLKDDKSYSYIKVTKDPYPIVYRTRNTNDKNGIYFGPFPSGVARDSVLHFLRKQFPFRSCSYAITDEDLEERRMQKAAGKRVKSRLCTYYHIGRCGGPCEGYVSKDEYMGNINNIKKFLQNKKKSLVLQLESQMKYHSLHQEYEKAAKLKQHIDALNYVTQKTVITYGDEEDDVRNLLFQKTQIGLEQLIKRLKIRDLSKMTKEEKAEYLCHFRMECFDISNIQGTNPVGSMVVFEGGLPVKAHYRKFKINIQDTPNDFKMMEEMLTRRLRYISPKTLNLKKNREKLRINNEEFKSTSDFENLKSEVSSFKFDNDPSFNSIPDLIIIDGGKGQLGKGIEVMHDLKFDLDDSEKTWRYLVPSQILNQTESDFSAEGKSEGNREIVIAGLAKRREEIFLPNQKTSYLFDDKQNALFLLQRIRDEAHRFGITFHRLRRSKAMLGM